MGKPILFPGSKCGLSDCSDKWEAVEQAFTTSVYYVTYRSCHIFHPRPSVTGLPSSGLENVYIFELLLNMSLGSDKASVAPVKLNSSSTGAPFSSETLITRSVESGQSSPSVMMEACRSLTGSRTHSSRPEDTEWPVILLEALKVRLWQPSPSFSITLTLSVMLWGVVPLSTDEFASNWSSRRIA